MHHHIFYVECIHEDWTAKHNSDVMKQGHNDKVKVHYEWVKDRKTIMETDSRICEMTETTEGKWAQYSYQGQPHRSDQWPLTWYYMVEVISADEMEGKRGSNQQLIRKVVDSDICQEPDKQAHTHTRTHIYKEKNNAKRRTARYTICQSKWSILATLSQHWHNPKSTWLKLDLSNSAQTISVTREALVLIEGTAWHSWLSQSHVDRWQVCALVHISIHSPTDIHTQSLQK